MAAAVVLVTALITVSLSLKFGRSITERSGTLHGVFTESNRRRMRTPRTGFAINHDEESIGRVIT